MTRFTDAIFAVWAGQHDDYCLYVCDEICENAVAIGQDGEDTIIRARLPEGREDDFRSCPEYVADDYAGLFAARPHLEGHVTIITEEDFVCYIDRVLRVAWGG